MSKTIVKVMGIIALVTFVIGMICAITCIAGGNNIINLLDGVSMDQPFDSDSQLLVSLFAIFGTSFIGVVVILVGIFVGLYNIVAHVPALIAYLIGKKEKHITIYWLMISLWLCFLLGTSVFILVF